MSAIHEDFQQIDIFTVLKEIQDIELIEKNIFKLMPGNKITTATCEVARENKFIVVRSVEFEEVFSNEETMLTYIKSFFECGKDNKKSVSSH